MMSMGNWNAVTPLGTATGLLRELQGASEGGYEYQASSNPGRPPPCFPVPKFVALEQGEAPESLEIVVDSPDLLLCSRSSTSRCFDIIVRLVVVET